MTFIFLLIAIFIIVLLLIPTIIFSVIRTILSILGFTLHRRPRGNASSRGYSQQGGTSGGTSSSAHNSSAHNSSGASRGARKKMFDKNEGEYVDFEEIKEDK